MRKREAGRGTTFPLSPSPTSDQGKPSSESNKVGSRGMGGAFGSGKVKKESVCGAGGGRSSEINLSPPLSPLFDQDVLRVKYGGRILKRSGRLLHDERCYDFIPSCILGAKNEKGGPLSGHLISSLSQLSCFAKEERRRKKRSKAQGGEGKARDNVIFGSFPRQISPPSPFPSPCPYPQQLRYVTAHPTKKEGEEERRVCKRGKKRRREGHPLPPTHLPAPCVKLLNIFPCHFNRGDRRRRRGGGGGGGGGDHPTPHFSFAQARKISPPAWIERARERECSFLALLFSSSDLRCCLLQLPVGFSGGKRCH